MNIKFNEKNNLLLFFTVAVILIFILSFIFTFPQFKKFFDLVENKSFDIRQVIISKNKKASSDIVIIKIDDKSYENLTQKYGDWPVPRDIYAKVTQYLESYNPKTITFDLMFIQSLKSKPGSDEFLIEKFSKYDNLFTAINFDNQEDKFRSAVNLPDNLKVSIVNSSDINFNNDILHYSNCRAILQGIINATKNIGHINLSREEDGIVRRFPVIVKYKNDFYPHLALITTNYFLNQNIDLYNISKNRNLETDNINIPLDKDGLAILNWYRTIDDDKHLGPFKAYSLVDIINAMEKGEKLNDFDIKNKMVFIGTSASSLYDIKSVPTDRYVPGIVILATFVNNLIDNSFIIKTSDPVNIALTVLLCISIAILPLLISSSIISTIAILTILTLFLFSATILMQYFNIWLNTVIPLISSVFTLLAVYIYKYLVKSKDFEQTYKLATTDVMTKLYNHRYFQDQMVANINVNKRYNGHFSLIMTDIDFFKKFNDTYGHQAGDTVLKCVAKVLKENIRATDIPCRYGGEEMSIILTNTDKKEALITAKKICEEIRKSKFQLNQNTSVNVTLSLGVSTYPQDGETANELIEYADSQLYKAKENGRNQVGNFIEEGNSQNN